MISAFYKTPANEGVKSSKFVSFKLSLNKDIINLLYDHIIYKTPANPDEI
jgi:hypothetical protein